MSSIDVNTNYEANYWIENEIISPQSLRKTGKKGKPDTIIISSHNHRNRSRNRSTSSSILLKSHNNSHIESMIPNKIPLKIRESVKVSAPVPVPVPNRIMTPRQQILVANRLAIEKRNAKKVKRNPKCDDNNEISYGKIGKALTVTNVAQLPSLIPPPPPPPNNNNKQYWRHTKSMKWEGNSDDVGSVDSGLLEENVCFECGLDTMMDNNWNKLVLCDVCDGEYHIECVKRDSVPRANFTCPRCVEEILEFKNLKYTMQDCGFPIKRRRGNGTQSYSLCYSPSRPLEIAFKECEEKGFMVISRLLSFDIMKKLTHGTVERSTARGRVAECWQGVIKEMAKRINSSCQNLILRGGRFDMRIPEFVVQELDLDNILLPVLERLKLIMGMPIPQLRTHNIVFVPVGSPEQNWHYDDKSTKQAKHHRYFTILVHLNTIDNEAGGTEIWSKKLRRADMVRPRPGDAFVFNGTLMHRGQANNGSTHRFFYYASFSCHADANTVELV